jgi:hypothetical protein
MQVFALYVMNHEHKINLSNALVYKTKKIKNIQHMNKKM